MSVDEQSPGAGSKAEVDELVEYTEESLEKLESTLDRIRQENEKAGELDKKLIADEGENELNQQVQKRIDAEEQDLEELRQAYQDIQRAEEEIRDIHEKISSDPRLKVFLAYSQEFDSMPSEEMVDRMVKALKMEIGQDYSFGTSDIEEVSSEAQSLEQEANDILQTLEEAFAIYQDVTEDLENLWNLGGQGPASKDGEKKVKEVHDELQIIHNIEKQVRGLTRDPEPGYAPKGNLKVLKQQLQWVTKVREPYV